MFYFIWIPITILLYVSIGWLSVRVNVSDNPYWYIPFVIIQMFPFWVIVAKFSKNITVDSLIYDVIIFLVSALSIGFFSGQIFSFSLFQIIGFVVVLIGFFLMQVR